MPTIDQKVAGAAAAATITSGMTASVPGVGQTFTVDDDTGWPATGRFTCVIDLGEPNEEKILCSGHSGTTFTVAARGYDGTVASSHTSNVSRCHHPFAATIAQALIDHVDDLEADPHSTKLLNNARHDIAARHQFGAALGTPGTPTALTPDIAGAAGVGTVPARSDHAHNVAAAAAVTSGLANAEGVSTSFARADHTHDQAALSVNTAELVDDAVTAAKAADGIIDTAAKVVNGVLTLGKFASVTGTDWGATIAFNNVTLGTGGVKFARYWKIERLVVMLCGFELGTSGNVTGVIEHTLPFPAADIAGFPVSDAGGGFTAARARDNSAASISNGIGAVRQSLQVARDWVLTGASGEWDATTPFDWAIGDSLQVVTIYESTT